MRNETDVSKQKTGLQAWSLAGWTGMSGLVACSVGFLLAAGLVRGVDQINGSVDITWSAAMIGLSAGLALFSVLIAVGFVRAYQERAGQDSNLRPRD